MRQADEMEHILTKKFARFLMQVRPNRGHRVSIVCVAIIYYHQW